MKRLVLFAALLCPSLASAQPRLSPYTLHSASMAYVRALERTCSVDAARSAAERQLSVARRAEVKSQALRDFIASGTTIDEHVITVYPTRYQAAVDRCTSADDGWRYTSQVAGL